MASNKKIRISVPVDEDFDKRLSKAAKRMGMSKASLCSYMISQQLPLQEKAWEMINDTDFLSQMFKVYTQSNDEETGKKVAQLQEAMMKIDEQIK